MGDKDEEGGETEDEKKVQNSITQWGIFNKIYLFLKAREAREEEFAERRDKFAKMEEEREKMRKGIRDKVQIMSRDQQVDFLIIFHYSLI
jgi:hypothetical protein